jgi:hypothetical protein
MMTLIKHSVLLTFTLAALSVHGEVPSKYLDQSMNELDHLETTTSQIHLSGYADAGYIYHFTGGSGPQVSFNGSDTSGGGDFNLNAFKVVLEKALTDKNEFQAGFRIDLMLGEDAGGLGSNGAAGSSDSLYLQQALVILRAPIGNGLDIQVGKIDSILSFEGEERPANLNITLGFNAAPDPGPAPGILATYPINERLTVIGGINNGNGQDNSLGLDSQADAYAFTGGLALTNEKNNAETQISFHSAPWGDAGTGQTENENLLGLNWQGTWAPQFAQDKLLLAFNTSFWMGNDFSAPAAAGALDDATHFYVAALYAKYQFNSLFSLAARGEYVHSDDNQFLALPVRPAALSNDILSWTLTAGFALSEELLFRAEYRLNYGSDVISNGAATLSGDSSHGLAAQVVYSF